MREERLLAEFPKTMPEIVKLYIEDLLKETSGMTDAQILSVKKKAFVFVREETESFIARDNK
jgi:hypothetical protein